MPKKLKPNELASLYVNIRMAIANLTEQEAILRDMPEHFPLFDRKLEKRNLKAIKERLANLRAMYLKQSPFTAEQLAGERALKKQIQTRYIQETRHELKRGHANLKRDRQKERLKQRVSSIFRRR